MRVKGRDAGERAFRPLDKREIDRRIETLIADLAQGSENCRSEGGAEEILPRALTARELVHRMRPFIVLN